MDVDFATEISHHPRQAQFPKAPGLIACHPASRWLSGGLVDANGLQHPPAATTRHSVARLLAGKHRQPPLLV